MHLPAETLAHKDHFCKTQGEKIALPLSFLVIFREIMTSKILLVPLLGSKRTVYSAAKDECFGDASQGNCW